MLGVAAMRIIRTKWKEPVTLSQELYALLSKPLKIEPSQIVINQSADATTPPIVINQPPGSTIPPFQINRGDQTVDLGSLGGGSGGGGGIDLGDIEFPEQDPGDREQAVPPSALNPIPLHGRVTGKTGGRTYSVRCWAKNPNVYPSLGVLPVEFPDVDPDDTIPSGTRCPVIMFPKEVFGVISPDFSIGYVPVFLQAEA